MICKPIITQIKEFKCPQNEKHPNTRCFAAQLLLSKDFLLFTPIKGPFESNLEARGNPFIFFLQKGETKRKESQSNQKEHRLDNGIASEWLKRAKKSQSQADLQKSRDLTRDTYFYRHLGGEFLYLRSSFHPSTLISG